MNTHRKVALKKVIRPRKHRLEIVVLSEQLLLGKYVTRNYVTLRPTYSKRLTTEPFRSTENLKPQILHLIFTL